ncbi:MAG: hypothetical protein JSV54_04950 [Chloroflexota bacterium]|nr:MAG: hypothetical protein JSV54_04950 [Chloroflexota bacterium]
MLFKRTTIYFLILSCCLFVIGVVFWPGAGGQQLQEQEFEENGVEAAGVSSQAEKQEYKQDMARIKDMEKSFKPGLVNDLEQYEKFADEIQKKWSRRNKEYNARLILEICGPLSSGTFEDDRRHDIARKYALSVLEKSEEISVEMELKLTGHVMTSKYKRNAPKGEDLAQRRKKDVEIRLHAWKRLLDAIDQNWDPNEEIWSPNAVGALMGLPSGMAPEGIKDPKLRAEYEAALQKNREEIERHTKQYRLHDWLKSYPKRAERYIVKVYSRPPFNLGELKQYLGKYAVDEKTRARILAAVTKNMEKAIKSNSSTQ